MINTKDDLQEDLKEFFHEAFDKSKKKMTLEEAFEWSFRSLEEELLGPKKPGTYFEVKSKEDEEELI